MIDMDNFKAINDNFGHLAGDETLKMFADTMKEFSKSMIFFAVLVEMNSLCSLRTQYPEVKLVIWQPI